MLLLQLGWQIQSVVYLWDMFYGCWTGQVWRSLHQPYLRKGAEKPGVAIHQPSWVEQHGLAAAPGRQHIPGGFPCQIMKYLYLSGPARKARS